MTGWSQLASGVVVLLLCIGGIADAVVPEPIDLCTVASNASQNAGQLVRVQGWLAQWPHDLLLVSEGCPNAIVVVTFANNPLVKPPASFSMQEDRQLKRLRRYLRKGYDPGLLRATVEGRFDVAEFAGFLRSADGRLVDVQGYGSPAPFTRFRLVLRAVEDVTLVRNAPNLQAPEGLGPEYRTQ